MDKQYTPGFACCLVIALVVAPAAICQQVEQPVFSGPPAPEQIKVLSPFMGEWKSEGTIRPSLQNKEGFTSKGQVSCQWIHNGHFLRIEGVGQSERGRFEITTIISYHRASGSFRLFTFTSDGIVSEGVGEWDDKTKTLTTKGVNLPAGWTAVGTFAIEKDRLVQTALVKNDKGEIIRDGTAVSQRKK